MYLFLVEMKPKCANVNFEHSLKNCEQTAKKNVNKFQTQRIGLALIAFTMATPIGSAISGPIFESTGYYGAFGVAAGGVLIAILYTLISIRF